MNKLKNINVLVTGASGFIGSHLTRRLVAEGATVSIFGRENNKNLEDIIDKLSVYKVDITKFEEVKKAIQDIKPKKVFNLAATTNLERSLEALNKAVEINLNGSLNLLMALNNIEYDCLINVGTIEEYGINKAPFHEDATIPEPVSPYSASKASLTMFSKMFYNTFNAPTITLRLSKVYGPYETVDLNLNKSLIPKLIVCGLLKKEFKLSGGNQYRDFIYINDTVDGFIEASVNKKAIGNIINLSAGKGHIIKEIVDKIVNIIGGIKIDESEPYRKGENMVFYSNNDKAKNLLNWEPKINLDSGLRKTIEWYKKMYDEGILKKWII
ncbi:MAG: dTDP-glucose 4,6-dehydratase [archaeon GW2011_AR20]|nr:MAG: dTDP-glucose 4,6-dehydratase [archaeon GW2011_AR20]AQS28199.1 hypothetical protein [uncultured archaeon]MBS3160507.1 SDR family NAD(P)-dependent oxidoreductase [Candidatus Woesearchaeota archaeon]